MATKELSTARPMRRALRRSALSSQSRQLIDVMRAIWFGSVEGLRIREGEPVLQPPPRVIREVKLGSREEDRASQIARDFDLKSEVVDLLREIRELRDGVIKSIEVKHGLPWRVSIEHHAGNPDHPSAPHGEAIR